MGICKFKRQSVQKLETNNQQVIYKTKKEKQSSEEHRQLNFDNYIKYKSCGQFWRADISNDEKYLAILGKESKKLQIYYLKSKKIIKIIQLENKDNLYAPKEYSGQQYIQLHYYEIIKFSNNSRHLLFGDSNGCIYCYDINNNFKLIYNQKVHSRYINNILTIDDGQILTSSSDFLFSSLIITDIKSNQFLNNNKIVVICDKSILILDKDLVVLQSIKHNIEIELFIIFMIEYYSLCFYKVYVKTKQVNSLNYIIIPGIQYVQVYKKVRKLK